MIYGYSIKTDDVPSRDCRVFKNAMSAAFSLSVSCNSFNIGEPSGLVNFPALMSRFGIGDGLPKL